MNITLVNLPSRFDACEVFNAAVFYGEKLLSRKMLESIDLRVVFVKNLEKDHQIVGDCGWEDDNYRPREFMIRVDANMNKRRTMITLAHEMVHAKQYARGEMRDMMRREYTRWHKEPVDTDNTNYWDLPWEIEAHGRETGLYERFKVHWWKEKKNAQEAYKAKSNRSRSPHSFVLKESSEEQEGL